MKKIFTIAVLLVSSLSFAHRDSDLDNLSECGLNKTSLEGHSINVSCNDLYHLYDSKAAKTSKRGSSFNMGAFNIFKLGSGDSRFKDYKLTANIIKNYDVVAVSEMHHSISEEYESNMNLLKHPELDFKNLYHKPGYLKLLLELRKSNTSWSLIISPVGQSDNEELLGFYYRKDRVSLRNSEYCEVYNRKLREKKNLVFAGGTVGPKHTRPFESPHLNKSYACLLDITEDENNIFRVPFSARFKIGSGFDFQMLSYHARYQEPISVGGSCGFECLEKVNGFLNKTFHKEGEFLNTLDSTALRLLKKHMDFLTMSKSKDYALSEDYGPVIKFKYSKPRVYANLMKVKEVLRTELPDVVLDVWEEKYKDSIPKADRNTILNNMILLFSDLSRYEEFNLYIKEHGKVYKAFLKDIVNGGVFGEAQKRYKIWISPEKIARFNEVSLVLREMESIASLEGDTDVVLGGDLNLEDAKNQYYWDFFKDNFKYSTVAIGSKTSIGETNGLKSAYDHFMYDAENSMEECQPLEAAVLDFVNDKSYWKGFEHYFVKTEAQIHKLSKAQYERISKITYVSSKGDLFTTKDVNVRSGYTSCWDGQINKPASLADVWKNSFECKTLNQFINGPQRYRLYTDLVSDHLPIGMKCSKTSDLD
ncbi:MAG: hypothetical protein ACRBBP_08710 [Bdellovibrionales bacterium]